MAISFSGVVTAVDTGPVRGGCYTAEAASDSLIVALMVRAEVEAGSQDWSIEYQVPSNSVVWQTGDLVDVFYTTDGGGWVPVLSELILTRNHVVEVYVGMGGGVEYLVHAPFSFQDGPAVCWTGDTCATWTWNDLQVSGATASTRLPHGTATQVGDYRVIHGGLSLITSRVINCMDGMQPSVCVAALRNALH